MARLFELVAADSNGLLEGLNRRHDLLAIARVDGEVVVLVLALMMIEVVGRRRFERNRLVVLRAAADLLTERGVTLDEQRTLREFPRVSANAEALRASKYSPPVALEIASSCARAAASTSNPIVWTLTLKPLAERSRTVASGSPPHVSIPSLTRINARSSSLGAPKSCAAC